MNNPIYPHLVIDGIDRYAQHQAWLYNKGYDRDQRLNIDGVKPVRLVCRGADLRNADLHDAILRRANLSSANLAGADLTRANLDKANMIGADLRGTNLHEVYLIGTDLRCAKLRGAIMDI